MSNDITVASILVVVVAITVNLLPSSGNVKLNTGINMPVIYCIRFV